MLNTADTQRKKWAGVCRYAIPEALLVLNHILPLISMYYIYLSVSIFWRYIPVLLLRSTSASLNFNFGHCSYQISTFCTTLSYFCPNIVRRYVPKLHRTGVSPSPSRSIKWAFTKSFPIKILHAPDMLCLRYLSYMLRLLNLTLIH